VEVLTLDNSLLAQAACRYRAALDANATDHWQGRLHRVEPPEALTEGRFRLRFPNGATGDVTIATVAPESTVIYFEGIGDRPVSF
jgi:hypothetical protein